LFSPLEQFENHFLYRLNTHLGGKWVVQLISTVTVTTLVVTSVLLLLLWLGFSNPTIRPGKVQSLIEAWWSAAAGVVRQQLNDNQFFTPLLVWTFGWLALHNLVGLVPYNFTVTAHLSTTLFLALGFNLGFLFWGLFYHSFRFFGLFVPQGAPIFLLPLIVVIEIVSYCIRPVSLALRLFANMMAGHTLMHILVGFVVGAPLLTTALVLVGIFAVTLLEFGIALLQAYVFVVLCCIYIRDALEPGH
jgi:F-type H+-transporting ATPase subunit a